MVNIDVYRMLAITFCQPVCPSVTCPHCVRTADIVTLPRSMSYTPINVAKLNRELLCALITSYLTGRVSSWSLNLSATAFISARIQSSKSLIRSRLKRISAGAVCSNPQIIFTQCECQSMITQLMNSTILKLDS